MPFTLAHPAAVIPLYRLARRRLSLSALVIGSMAPDFVYFLPMPVSGIMTHSLPGMALFCAPAGLLVYVVFTRFAKHPLTTLLPSAIFLRLAPQTPSRSGVGHWCAIIAALMIGTFTHIAWDAFTHRNSVIVNSFDWLRMPLNLPSGMAVPLYKILQHTSSVLGLICLAACLLHWLTRTPMPAQQVSTSSARQRSVALGLILLSGLCGSVLAGLASKHNTLERIVFDVVVNGMTSVVAAALAFCCWWHWHTLHGGNQR